MKVIGVIRMPPRAPIAADTAKESPTTALVLMPTRRAASLLAAVASTALPVSVRVRKYQSATTIVPAPPRTMTLWGRSAAPPTIQGALPA